MVVNDRGALLAFCLTPGNVDDRRPVPRLARRLSGGCSAAVRRLFGGCSAAVRHALWRQGLHLGDKGYISQALAEALLVTQGLRLITKLRKNMRTRLLTVTAKVLLRKRALIETIVDQLKNLCQIEHSRHRSPLNFLLTLLAGLIAYCHQPKKPALDLDPFIPHPVRLIPN